MQYSITLLSLLAVVGLCHAGVLESRANGKANEYPNPQCKDNKGGNKATFPHKPLCGCISMDTTTASVYIATGPSQHVTAFSNANCNPGEGNQEILGSTGGGPCVELDSHFPNGRIQSLLFNVNVVCSMGSLIAGLPEEAALALKAAAKSGLV